MAHTSKSPTQAKVYPVDVRHFAGLRDTMTKEKEKPPPTHHIHPLAEKSSVPCCHQASQPASMLRFGVTSSRYQNVLEALPSERR